MTRVRLNYVHDMMDTTNLQIDEQMMRIALQEAEKSAANDEVPVGAVLVDKNGIVARDRNNCIAANDPTGHAEMRVLRKAGKKRGNYRLPETTLYVTLEPCAMCAAALVHARVGRIVFGAADPKAGGLISQYAIGSDGKLNHSFSITSGVLEIECSQQLKDFFKVRRARRDKKIL